MNQLYLFFVGPAKKIFLVCCRILVTSSYVPWDEKGWKSLLYTLVSDPLKKVGQDQGISLHHQRGQLDTLKDIILVTEL